jgi:hypothetical protein
MVNRGRSPVAMRGRSGGRIGEDADLTPVPSFRAWLHEIRGVTDVALWWAADEERQAELLNWRCGATAACLGERAR